jgi:hypothetical protein
MKHAGSEPLQQLARGCSKCGTVRSVCVDCQRHVAAGASDMSSVVPASAVLLTWGVAFIRSQMESRPSRQK